MPTSEFHFELFQGVGFISFVYHTLPGVIILTIVSYIQIRYSRYIGFRNITSLQNADTMEVSTIRHELKMWESTDRSISTISKFDEISRSVIHSRVVLLNEALQRELESSHRRSHENTDAKNLSFYLIKKKVSESSTQSENVDKDDAHEQLTLRLEEMVFTFLSSVKCLI